MMMRALLAASICSFALGFASVASAAPSAGEALFREGRAAMQNKDYESACSKFAESQKLEPAPGTALNLGECEEQRGHLIASNEAFVLAASTFTSPDKQKYATSRAEAVDRKIPRFTVRASASMAGLSIRIGTSVVIVDTEQKHDPGEIVLHAEAPGKKPKDLPVTLRESKSLDIDIGPLEADNKDDSAAATPTTNTTTTPIKPPTHAPNLRTVGLIVGGVGAASLIVGGVTGVIALGRASTVKDHCDANLACDSQGVDAASSGSTFSLVSTITIVAGGALLVGGAVLFFVSPRVPAPSSSTSSALKATTRLVPTASRDGGGLVLRGSF